MSTLVSVRTDESTVEKLNQIAASMDRNRNWVINEAISNYLELHAWRLERIQSGIADTDSGRSVTLDEVRARISKKHKDRLKLLAKSK